MADLDDAACPERVSPRSEYISGNSVGTISVQAPEYDVTMRRYPVPSGLDDASLNIVMEETWTRPASETRWWMSVVE
jgi:hypothetical protein